MAGKYGGAAFILIYLIFLVLLGLPVLVCEFAVGRASRKSTARAFHDLEPEGANFHNFSYMSMVSNYVLMMFYTMVAGWMLYYCYAMAAGKLDGKDSAQVADYFTGLQDSAGTMTLWMIIVVVLSFGVCSLGVQRGLEKITKVMMICLLALIVVLAVHSLTLDGAMEGVKFYLVPDFGKIDGSVVVGAMNQAFFTLSVGMGGMAIFGSYIEKEHSLMGESVHIIVLDTLVAVLAGIIMFPACFTYGLEVNAGPSLLFDTMATVFNNMTGGRWWGTLFFLFMVFAALSTVLGVCENILAMVRELTGLSRPKGALLCGVGIFLLALTTALGYSVLHFQPFAAGTAWLDLWDFIVSNNILPLGSLVLALFCCNSFGWGWDAFVQEANTGKGLKVQPWMKPIFRFVVPAAIAFIYIYGMATFAWN